MDAAVRAATETIRTEEALSLLDSKTSQLRLAVNNCLRDEIWEPALVLLYCGMDAMSWLDRPASAADVDSKHFKTWVGQYVVPRLDGVVTGEDLYGARCGILHSLTGESKLHRTGKVKKLFYGRVSSGVVKGLIQLRFSEPQLPPMLNIEFLSTAFFEGVAEFKQEVLADTGRWDRVRERVLSAYFTVLRRGSA